MKAIRLAAISATAVGLVFGGALAQDEEFSAMDATLEGDALTVDVTSPQAGWAVVHTVGEDGKAGAHIGHAAVEAGENADVTITLEEPVEGDELIVMLHEDAGTEDTFEFGPDDKTDAPVMKDDEPVQATVTISN